MIFYVQTPCYHHAKEHTPSLPWYDIKWKTLGTVHAADPESAIQAAKLEFPHVANPVISSRNDGICAGAGGLRPASNRRAGGSQLRRKPRPDTVH